MNMKMTKGLRVTLEGERYIRGIESQILRFLARKCYQLSRDLRSQFKRAAPVAGRSRRRSGRNGCQRNRRQVALSCTARFGSEHALHITWHAAAVAAPPFAERGLDCLFKTFKTRGRIFSRQPTYQHFSPFNLCEYNS